MLSPPSPITSLTKKFRSRSTRGFSLDGLQALSAVDRKGDFVLTPVGSDTHDPATAVGDGEVSLAGSDMLDDACSEDSGDSADGTATSSEPRGAEDGGSRKPRRAIKIARGLSNAARRLTKRSMGASEAMTIGRASLMEKQSSNSSNVLSHDLNGEGASSYTVGWGDRAVSPGQGTRCACTISFIFFHNLQFTRFPHKHIARRTHRLSCFRSAVQQYW